MAAKQDEIDHEEIKECAICKDSFKNLKRLPCLHPFCLGCLEKYGEDERPGDKMNCPLCRQTFTIPPEGFGELPDDITAEQRFGGALNTSDSRSICHVCSEKRAANYCAECAQDVCDACFGHHQTICNTQFHDKPRRKADLLSKFKSSRQEIVSCFAQLNQCAEAIESEYELLEEKESGLESSQSEDRQEIAQIRKEMRDLHSANDQLQTKLATTSSENRILVAKLQECNAEITSLKDHTTHITNEEIVGLKEKVDELEKKTKSLDQQLLFARNEAACLKEQLTTADKEASTMNKQQLNANENIFQDVNHEKEQVIHLKEEAPNLRMQNQLVKREKERPPVPFRKRKQDDNTSRKHFSTETATMEVQLTEVSKATIVLEDTLQKVENMTLEEQDENSEKEEENPQQQFLRRPSNLMRLRDKRDEAKNAGKILALEAKILNLRKQLEESKAAKHKEQQSKAEQESAKSKHEINRSKRYSLQS